MNGQIALAVVLLVLLLAFWGLVIWDQTYGWRVQRRLDRVAVDLQATTVHSQADLEAAVDVVKGDMLYAQTFEPERIWYDPAQAGPLERELLTQHGVQRPEDVVVLFVDYQAAGSGETEGTSTVEYRYDLVRDDSGGWYVTSARLLHGAEAVATPMPTPTPKPSMEGSNT